MDRYLLPFSHPLVSPSSLLPKSTGRSVVSPVQISRTDFVGIAAAARRMAVAFSRHFSRSEKGDKKHVFTTDSLGLVYQLMAASPDPLDTFCATEQFLLGIVLPVSGIAWSAHPLSGDQGGDLLDHTDTQSDHCST